jgi:hypothetical protein
MAARWKKYASAHPSMQKHRQADATAFRNASANKKAPQKRGPFHAVALGSDRSGDDDLDLVVRRCKRCFTGRAGRRVGLVDPAVPDCVHFSEVLHVCKPDDRLEDLGLVGTSSCQQTINFSQNGLGLIGHARAWLANLAGEINCIAVNDGLAHAWSDFDTTDAHGELLS